MTLIFEQQQYRHSSRVNILVLLLMLFVISAHCSSAMAQASVLDSNASAAMDADFIVHCDGVQDADDSSESCWDDHCPSAVTLLQSQSSKQDQPDFDQTDLVTMPTMALPYSRAGPCESSALYLSPDLSSSPLYYQLCVLRL